MVFREQGLTQSENDRDRQYDLGVLESTKGLHGMILQDCAGLILGRGITKPSNEGSVRNGLRGIRSRPASGSLLA